MKRQDKNTRGVAGARRSRLKTAGQRRKTTRRRQTQQAGVSRSLTSPPGKRPSRAKVRTAVARLGRATEKANIAAQEVLQVIDGVEHIAIEQHLEAAARSLLEQGIGNELLRLERCLAEGRALTSDEAFEFGPFPGLVLDWLREWLGLEPMFARSPVAEVAHSALENFDIEGEESFPRPQGPVRLEVRAAGWKRKGKLIRRPVARYKEPVEN